MVISEPCLSTLFFFSVPHKPLCMKSKSENNKFHCLTSKNVGCVFC